MSTTTRHKDSLPSSAPHFPAAAAPGPRHLWIILAFALLMAAWYTLVSFHTPYEMGHDQTYVGTMLAKDRDPSLYLRDFTFQDDTIYRGYIPAVLWLFQKLSHLTGSFDNALLAVVPVVVFLFTLGTALLLLEWSQSLWLALVLTLLAIPYRPAPSGELWGAGGVEFVLARTMATSLAPFVFLLFFRLLGEPGVKRAAFTGMATGTLAFLHPPTALFLGELFAGLFILTYFWERRGWLLLLAMLAAYFLMAFVPLTFMEQQGPTPAAALDFQGLREVIHSYLKIPKDWGSFPGDPTERRVWLFLGATVVLGLNYLLRPAHRAQAARQGWCWGNLVILYICWRLAGKGAGFTWLYLVAAVYVVWSYRCRDLDRRDWWLLGMGFVVLAISILPYYFLTLLWLRIDSLWLTSLVIEHYRAVRLVHPFFYLFSAQAARYLVPQAARWLGTSPPAALGAYSLLALTMFSRLLFWLSLAGLGLWQGWRTYAAWRRFLMIGTLCLAVALGAALALAPAKRQDVLAWAGRDLGLDRPRVDFRADEELYAWARTATPPQALFFHGKPLFRFRAQRSITHALGDLINHREARYVEIFRRYHRLEQAYSDPARLLAEARALGADYVVVEKSRRICLPLAVCFENGKYLVYRLPAAGSQTGSAGKP